MRKLKYEEVDLFQISLNPHLIYICNGDTKEIIIDKETDDE